MFRIDVLSVAGLWLIGSASLATETDPADRSEIASVCRKLDALVEQDCTQHHLRWLGPCSDSEFLRRVWLDLAGRVPPISDARKIAKGTELDRDALVAKLLASQDFARHWGRLWSEYLTDRRPIETPEYDGRQLSRMMTEAFAENRSYREFVQALILGEGTSDVSGGVNFLLRHNAEPVPLAGAVSQKLLGLSLQCAECHDHPHARWKQKDFWGLAAHFARLRKMTPVSGEPFSVVIERPHGELTMVDKRATPNAAGELPSRTVFPQLPSPSRDTRSSPRSDPSRPRRAVVVEWLTSPDNPYPSRHLVNQLWERLVGSKLQPNLDQWPPETPSTETEILNLLADDLVHSGWDVQRTMRIIVSSKVYQRRSHNACPPEVRLSGEQYEAERTHFSRARVRPLSADQLHCSLAQAFGYHFDENDHRLAEATGEEFAQDIPLNNLGPTSFTLGRALALYNSDYVRGAVELGAEATVRIHGPAAGAEQIERLFLALLTRVPTIEEREFFQDLGGMNDPREGLQDVIWVLLNSTEFVTNH